jgi:predicted RNase H-like HicB family nuclease
MKYAIVIERGINGYGAYVPDLPGCAAVGESEDEARLLIREAIEFHLEGLRALGESIPAPCSQVEYVDVPIAA